VTPHERRQTRARTGAQSVLLNEDLSGSIGHPDPMAAQIVQPEDHILRPDLDLAHADFGCDGSVSANVEGVEAMESHADPSGAYATHQYSCIGYHVR
jgi:hypothetical protein